MFGAFKNFMEGRHGQTVIWILAGLIAAGAMVAVAHDILAIPGWPMNTDTELYITAAQAIARGDNPYADHLYPYDPYAYPPLFAEVLAVFVPLLGEGMGWLVWTALSVAVYVMAAAVLLRGFGYKAPWAWVALASAVTLMAHVTRIDLVHGQINIHVLLLLAVGLKLHLTGHSRWGALAWGIMFSLKPFTGIAVLFLMRRGEWKSAVLSLGAGAGIVAATLLVWGPRAIEILQGWLSVSRYYTTMPFVAKPDNQSFYGFLQRAFSPNTFGSEWLTAPWLIAPAMTAIVLLAALVFLMGVKPAPFQADPDSEKGARALLGVGITLALAMACGPLFEGDHLYILAPGLVGSMMLARRRLSEHAPNARLHLVSATMWVLAFILLLSPLGIKLLRPHLWGPVDGIKTLLSLRNGAAFFAAAAVSAWVLWREQRASTGDKLPATA